MKKYILLGFTAIVFSKMGFTQNSKNSIITQKNEIGLDLIPAIKFLSGSGSHFENYKSLIQYKRKINNNLYFRIGVTSVLPNQRFRNYPSENVKRIYQKCTLNSGLEYRWGKKNIKYFTGMDLGYIFSKTTNTDFDLQNNVTSSYTTTKNGVSITPFFGMQYHFSKKFFFSMQLGPELGYIFGKRQPIVNAPAYLPLKFKEYNLTGGILSNFSLFYKF